MDVVTEESQTLEPEDLFKSSFKMFKSSKSPQKIVFSASKHRNLNNGGTNEDEKKILIDSDVEDVSQILLDPTNGNCDFGEEWDTLFKERCINTDKDFLEAEEAKKLGLRCPSTWKIYDLKFPEGLIFIRNPFTSEGQRFWISRSVIDFPKSPHITNIDNLENKEGRPINDKMTKDAFYKKLRWVTFGYHHNWDSKEYSEDEKCEFPQDLGDLTKFMAKVLGFTDFKAEASIANYYHLDSILSGHVDRSEANQEAPLFSLSFGQSAVFLIGGKSKTVKPQAIALRSGDVAIMSGSSRAAYHGVPKVFKTKYEPWNFLGTSSNLTKDEIYSSKRLKLDKNLESDKSDKNKTNSNVLNIEWTAFLSNYVSKSRINLNIRQVLFPGHTELCQSRKE